MNKFGIVKKYFAAGYVRGLILIVFCLLMVGCMSTQKVPIKVDSTPPDALISVHETPPDGSSTNQRMVAGTTPVEQLFEFGISQVLWLEVEKRGYQPELVQIGPETNQITVPLKPLLDGNGQRLKEYSMPKINQLLVVQPRIDVVERGFSKEEVSVERSKAAQEWLLTGIKQFFAPTCQVKAISESLSNNRYLKALWRDAKTAMEMVDPIRYKYQAQAPDLETRSSKAAAKVLGEEHQGEAILLMAGRQNIEKAGLKIAKIAMTAIGTATSYAGSYSRAMARGGGLFVYNIYIPHFSEGTLLKAALVDCSSGEILWVNKGVFGKFPFDDPESVKQILTDLMLGLELK